MPTHFPTDRTLISIAGAEAEHFLQNLVTCDVISLGADGARAGALLTPQGKIMFDFLVLRGEAEGFLIDIRQDAAAEFTRRLALYKLRAKVEIGESDQRLAAISWGTDSSIPGTRAVRDTRFPEGAGVRRHYGEEPSAGENDRDGWNAMRIEYGVAESPDDFEPGDAFPHDVSLDQNRGVDFRKGCYVGQEVVSRMQHRGTARRRVVTVVSEGPLPGPGSAIEAGGKPIGALGTVAGNKGLAIVRLDRARDAMDDGLQIIAGGAPVSLTIPHGAGYSWPDTSESGD